MVMQTVTRHAFNRGKVSRLGLGRVDVERVQLCAETQTNWMPRVLGSMMLRPGWKHLGSTLSDTQAFLIPFIKSTDNTAMLEFTNESLRVWKDDEVIQREEVATTVRGGDFDADVTNWAALSDPSSTPAGPVLDAAFSNDHQFAACAHTTTPFVTIYSITDETLTKLSDPATLPAGNATGVAFSPNSDFMAVTHVTSPFVTIYSISGTTFTKLSDPASLPAGIGEGVSFSPDGQFMAVAHATTPFITIYSISGTTFTKLDDPSSLPASTGWVPAWSPDSRFLAVAHNTTPFITIYDVNGTTFTKLSDPSSLPAGNALGAAFSRDGAWLSVAHETTPFVTNYAISGSTFTKASNPSTLPDNNGQEVGFTSDNQYLVVATTTTSPYHTIYRQVDGVWTKQTDLVSTPNGQTNTVAFAPNNRLMIIGSDTSPYIDVYRPYQWLDMDGSGAASTYLAGTYNTALDKVVAGSNTNGTAFNEATFRQVIPFTHITRAGDNIKVSFKGPSSGSYSIENCYIGYRDDDASNGWTYESAPTQIRWNGGSSGFSGLSGSTVLTSDATPFDLQLGRNLLVTWQIDGNVPEIPYLVDGSSATVYYKTSVNEAATVAPTGYTAIGVTADYACLRQITVLDSEAEAGLSLVGTGYNEARRTLAVGIATADINTEHAIRVTIEQGHVRFHVGTEFGGEDLVSETFLGAGTYSFAFTPGTDLIFVEVHSSTKYPSIVSQVSIENAGDLTLPTVYTDDDLTLLRYDQSGDVLYLACDGKPQYKIERRGNRSWGVAKYLPEDGPFRVENTDLITITSSALEGAVTLTASRDLFREDHVGALFRVSSTGQSVTGSLNGANQFTSYIKVSSVGTARNITVNRTGTWTATLTLQRSVSEPGTWTDVATFTTNGTATYNDDLDNQIIYYRIGIKTGDYTSGTAVPLLTHASGAIDGIARITDWNSPTNVDAIVLSPMGSTTAQEHWNEGVWSDFRGYPSSVALYEGRLAWAGMDKIILSESDGYENFNDFTVGDSGPIIRQIGQGPVDDIHWLLPLQRLIAGSEGSEFSIRSNSFDEPLTPDNFNMKPASTQGSAAVGAIRIDSNGMFVERSGTRVYQLTYDYNTYDYSSGDLTRLVPDQCSAGIRRIVLQRHPDTRVHVVLDDGTVALLVFEPDEDIVCWLDITTDGTIEDVAVLPSETLEDAVYYVVNRTINGETKRFVERWALETECVGGTLSKNIDSHVIYQGAGVTTITGLDHLEGETVVVWGNGKDLGSFTVSGGQITGLSESVTDAVVGLPYTAQYKSAKLAYTAELGSPLNRRKMIHNIGIIAADMHHEGLEYGDSLSYLRGLPQVYRSKDVPVDTVHEDYDDDLIPINKSWGTDTRLCLQATSPRPVTVLAITTTIQTNG